MFHSKIRHNQQLKSNESVTEIGNANASWKRDLASCISLCIGYSQLVCLDKLAQGFKHLWQLLAIVCHPLAEVEALDLQVFEDPGLPGPGWGLTPHASVYH